ncbi:MAG: CopD family protein [Caldimonas sp.]
MLYAALKAIHLLSVVAWVGGMFFMHVCLRPAAAATLEPPARLRLMHATMKRFFDVVVGAIVLVLASGAAMMAIAGVTAARSGLKFNVPLDWYAMVVVFVVMVAVFVHVRLVLFRRLGRAVAAEAWPQGAAALAGIRREVMINLVLGAFVVALMRLGGTA